jgi:hypothetical protein
MKQKILFIGSIFTILLLALMTACTTQTPVNEPTIPMNGRVVMTVTDAAVNMGEISSIMITIDKVSLHSDAESWVDVSTVQHTYDLLELKRTGTNALLADLSLAPARYDQIRLYVSKVIITDNTGSYDAKLPSNVLRLNGEIVVLANKTATVSFDFIADESVHKTGKGQYILAPVIQLESRTDGGADTSKNDNVRLFNGAVQTSSRVGMDSLGNLVIGGKLPPFLEINEDGTISGTETKLVPKNNSNAPPNPDDLNSRIVP